MSDILPVVEGVLWDIPRGPKARGVYHHKPPNTRRWYITHIDRLVMVHMLYTMLNIDEVYMPDINLL